MSHVGSHGVTDAVLDNVTDGVRPSGVTQGVTLLQTRPDQTRVLIKQFCGLWMANQVQIVKVCNAQGAHRIGFGAAR